MKKIVAVITLLLAFTISAQAQDSKKKDAPELAAKKEAVEMREFLGLSAGQQDDFSRLLQMKHEVLNDQQATEERKKEMSRIVGLKIEASLDADQLAKLKGNTALWKKLTE